MTNVPYPGPRDTDGDNPEVPATPDTPETPEAPAPAPEPGDGGTADGSAESSDGSK